MSVNQVTSFREYNPNYTNKNQNKRGKYLREGVILTSALGVGAALAVISKRQGFSLKLSDIKKTPIKDWAIFRLFDKKQPFMSSM